mgnify:FL=1
MLNSRSITFVLAFLVGTILTACGGGGSGGEAIATSSTSSEVVDVTNGSNTINPDNRAPNADAGADQNATSGETVTIDGAASFDPDGDTLLFYWQQTEGDSLTLPDNRNSSISFIAPMVAAPSRYRVQLSVSDGALSDTDGVSVLVFPLVDSVPPVLVSRSPQINESGIATSTVVTAIFNEPIAISTVTDESFSITRNNINVAGSVSYNAETFAASFVPEAELEAGAEYTVTLSSGFEDVAGNPYGGTSWIFTTGSRYNLGQTDQSTIDTCMSETDKQMLTRVNNARQQARTCGSSPYAATALLAWHCSLAAAAQRHSTDMAVNNFFSHTGSDGTNAGQRISATGYPWHAWGENIAAGYATVESVVTGWLNSPGHCSNIMNPTVTEMGAASTSNSSSDFQIYWTQVFADR